MKRTGIVVVIMFFCGIASTVAQVIPAFAAPDTVCLNQTFTVQNQSTGSITSNYWSFCPGNQNGTPTPTNLGNVGGQLSYPVYYSIAKQGNNYYAFVSNNANGDLVRLFYGGSLLNTPTVTMLGNLGGLPAHLEDLHLEYEAGNWYGIIVGGIPGGIYQLSFGNSLSNVPTLISFGNIGGLSYPQRLQVFRTGGNFYAFTCNRNNSTITRFDFGNSISNTPTATNLGNIGGLSTCDDLAIINYNGSWYGYIVNEGNNTLTRLDFGTSLVSTPTGTNLGNTGSLDMPRGIDVYVECGSIKGLIVNRNSNDLLKMNFSGGPTAPLVSVSLGNIANFSFPHSIERFRSGDTLYAIIPNVNNNTLSRIYYPGCTNASVPSSVLFSPPLVSYNQTGTYQISYIANEGQITQAALCKNVVVVANPTVSVAGKTICVGSKTTLTATGASSYSWSNSHTTSVIQVTLSSTTVYTVQGTSAHGCKSSSTVQVLVKECPGIAEFSQDVNLEVYPNPGQGEITVSCDAPLTLSLFDALGKEVRRLEFSSDRTQHTLQDLTPGLYVLKSEGGHVARKLVVQGN